MHVPRWGVVPSPPPPSPFFLPFFPCFPLVFAPPPPVHSVAHLAPLLQPRRRHPRHRPPPRCAGLFAVCAFPLTGKPPQVGNPSQCDVPTTHHSHQTNTNSTKTNMTNGSAARKRTDGKVMLMVEGSSDSEIKAGGEEFGAQLCAACTNLQYGARRGDASRGVIGGGVGVGVTPAAAVNGRRGSGRLGNGQDAGGLHPAKGARSPQKKPEAEHPREHVVNTT